jgi:ribonucleoside-diphosphate reductase alpha chain
MSNMFKRESLSGEFIQINKYLVNDLRQLGLWTQEIRNMIKMSDGSIQNIDKIPNNIRERYKTVWELSMKVLINMAANRGIYVDQSQSLNIFLRNPDIAVLSSVFFLLYSKNFKSSYYLRSRGASEIMKTTVSGASNGQESRKKVYTEQEKLVCSLENPESCEACQ